MESSNPHLFVSVFLSPVGLNQQKYELRFTESKNDKFHRLGRFFSGLHSLTVVPWKSIRIFFDTEDIWKSEKANIHKNIESIFPTAEIFDFRLSTSQEWMRASELYESDEIIYLHTNDDHAFVAESVDEFLWLCKQMKENPQLKMGAVTHFPEMTGMLARKYLNRKNSNVKRAIKVNSAIGTSICRADFFKSWWTDGNFKDGEIVVRPDNPLGRQVSFVQADLLIPSSEIIRHMDGYSHVRIMKPLTPLRNTHRYLSENSTPLLIEEWVRELWPKKLYAMAGGGADLHSTVSKPGEKLSIRYRASVAHLQSYWLLRISFREGFRIIKTHHEINIFQRWLVVGSAFFNITIFLNLIDKFVDLPVIVLLKFVEKIFGRLITIKFKIIYWGTWRSVLFHISGKK